MADTLGRPSGPSESQSAPLCAAPKVMPIQIGASAGPVARYLRYDSNRDLLLSDTADLEDPWWGLHFVGYPEQPVIVGRSPPMVEVFKVIEKAAYAHTPVLLYGPSGTGKEATARALASPRTGKFVPVNCGIARDGVSFEDTFFGRVDKILGGATSEQGAFQEADGGVLHPDNLDCLSWDQQGKLLRVVDTRPQTIRRVGSRTDEKVDVRIIVATNKEPEKLVQQQRLRGDLLARLNVIRIDLPPLCERQGDIPLLIAYLLLKKRDEFPRQVRRVSAAALRKASAYEWPWNIRELDTAISAALVLGEGPVLCPEEFQIGSEHAHSGRCQSPFAKVERQRSALPGMQTPLKFVLDFVRGNPGCTTRDLAWAQSCSVRTAQRRLGCLVGTQVELRKDKIDRRLIRYYLSDGTSVPY